MFPDWKQIAEWARVAPTQLAKYLEGSLSPVGDSLARRGPAGELYASLIARPDESTDLTHSDVWDDMQVSAAQAGGASNLTSQAYRDTGFEMLFFSRSQADTLHVTCQLPHEYKRGSEVRFHLHIIPMAATGGTAVFDYSYTSANVNDPLPAIASWTTGQASVVIAAGDQFLHRPAEIVHIPLPTARESRIILMKVARNPGLDTYKANAAGGGAIAANIGLLSLDFHVLRNRLGSIEESPV